jgi:hypothetical protein
MRLVIETLDWAPAEHDPQGARGIYDGAPPPTLIQGEGLATLRLYASPLVPHEPLLRAPISNTLPPFVAANVVLQDADLASVHIAWSGPASHGQRWHHYVQGTDGQWYEQLWRQLDEDAQRRILTACLAGALPEGSKLPGAPAQAISTLQLEGRVTYLLAVVHHDGGYVDLVDPSLRYDLGYKVKKPTMDEHAWIGFVSYPSERSLFTTWKARGLLPQYARTYPLDLALLQCRAWGRILATGADGPIASTSLRPLVCKALFRYTPPEAVVESSVARATEAVSASAPASVLAS